MKKKPTIAELEKILQSDDERMIKILPNGEVRAVKTGRKKPLMFQQEKLGGEY